MHMKKEHHTFVRQDCAWCIYKFSKVVFLKGKSVLYKYRLYA